MNKGCGKICHLSPANLPTCQNKLNHDKIMRVNPVVQHVIPQKPADSPPVGAA